MNITPQTNETEYINWKSWSTDFGKLSQNEYNEFNEKIIATQKAFDKNICALEIGFGNGKFLSFAKRKNWNITGTELNASLVTTANKHGYAAINDPELELLPNGQFDIVTAFDVLEHISDKDLPSFLKKILSKLKPDGIFIARFPNGDSPLGLPYQNGDITHASSIGFHKINYLISTTGFQKIYYGPEILPHKKILKNKIKFDIKKIALKLIDRAINKLFFNGADYCFSSPNIEIILKKMNTPQVNPSEKS